MSLAEDGIGSSGLDVSEADPDFPWDVHVASSPYGCFSHLTGWLESLERLTGSKLHRLVLRKGRTVVALYPLFVFRRRPFRFVYSPPLRGAIHHMGPVFIKYDSLTERKKIRQLVGIQRSLDAFLSTRVRCSYVEMRMPPGFLDARAHQWAGYRTRLLYTRTVDLTEELDRIQGRCSPDLRRNVRRCEGRVISREASSDELPEFIRLVRKRYQEVGASYPLTERFLSDLFRILGERQIRLFLAEESGDLQTGLILAMHGGRATVWHGSIRPYDSRLAVGDHLHWFALSWAKRNGFHELELMDADSPRLEEFKSKFGGELQPILHVERSSLWVRMAERIGRESPALF